VAHGASGESVDPCTAHHQVQALANLAGTSEVKAEALSLFATHLANPQSTGQS
jgi:hypothetical protein